MSPQRLNDRYRTCVLQPDREMSDAELVAQPMGDEMPRYDFNRLERMAKKYIDDGNVADAIKIYLFMSDGDPSLDAGYLKERLGICYERLGDLHAAKYWFGRAVEENPEVRLEAAQAYERLSNVGIGHLL